MQVISDTRSENCWITAIIKGRWVQAKVYDEPSTFGVKDCRVSKLAISKNDKGADGYTPFHSLMAYHWDRGLDFDDLNDPVLLQEILDELNALPPTEAAA